MRNVYSHSTEEKSWLEKERGGGSGCLAFWPVRSCGNSILSFFGGTASQFMWLE